MTTDPRPDSSSAHHDAQVSAVLNVLRLAVGETIGSSGLGNLVSPWLREVAERCVHAVRAPVGREMRDAVVAELLRRGKAEERAIRAENARGGLARRLDDACQEIDDAYAALHHAGHPRQSGERLADTIGRAFAGAAEVREQRDRAQVNYARVRGALGAGATDEPLWEQVARLVAKTPVGERDRTRKPPRFQLDERTNRRGRHLRSGGTVWVHPGDPAPIELELYDETGVAFGSDDEVRDLVDTLTAAIALPPLDPPAAPVAVGTIVRDEQTWGRVPVGARIVACGEHGTPRTGAGVRRVVDSTPEAWDAARHDGPFVVLTTPTEAGW